ncbi:MAG: helix-turn-helix transcriptional regulator [Lachnospiraceae bacterium]|nr:helix-turn-helix transcriptional regulator [Lachnospiraceae bacterium]
MNITIGENIKKLRNQKGITQERLAESIGVTPQAISRWESESGYPAIEYLPDLAGFFGISVDELLGVKLSERESRRENIYTTINHIEDCGYNPSAIDLLREAHADFPSDMKISLSLAKALCSERFEENPNKAYLREAEKMLRDLIRQSDDYDFRFECVRFLAVLYKEAFKDEQGYEEVVKKLPSINSCREMFITDLYDGAHQKEDEIRDCLITLSRCLVSRLRDYVAYILPNEEDKWEAKIHYLERMIDFCRFITDIIGEEKSVILDGNIAMLYRYMATYYVALGNKAETLTSLENMLIYVEKICKTTTDESLPHNTAWYYLPYLGQERYDPVRKEERFITVKEKMEKLAK